MTMTEITHTAKTTSFHKEAEFLTKVYFTFQVPNVKPSLSWLSTLQGRTKDNNHSLCWIKIGQMRSWLEQLLRKWVKKLARYSTHLPWNLITAPASRTELPAESLKLKIHSAQHPELDLMSSSDHLKWTKFLKALRSCHLGQVEAWISNKAVCQVSKP